MTAREILKEMMAQRGMSEIMLAEASGYSVGAIGSYLHDRENYRMGTYCRLVGAMDGQVIIRLWDDMVLDMVEETEKTAIKRMRLQKRWTYRELAEAAGYSSQMNIISPLRGKTSMRTDIVLRLVTAMRGEIVVRDTEGEYVMEAKKE